jgi:hypothetical protein
MFPKQRLLSVDDRGSQYWIRSRGSRQREARRIAGFLALIESGDLLDHYLIIYQLSGGQSQRVALARSAKDSDLRRSLSWKSRSWHIGSCCWERGSSRRTFQCDSRDCIAKICASLNSFDRWQQLRCCSFRPTRRVTVIDIESAWEEDYRQYREHARQKNCSDIACFGRFYGSFRS